MAFRDLREYLKALEGIGELKVIEGADWDMEIGAIAEIVGENKGPTLLFDKIKGYPQGYRVATNLFCNPRQYCLPYGLSADVSELEAIHWWKEKLKNFTPIKPIEVNTGPVMENIQTGEKIDMLKFPTPKWHELDGGRYLGTGSITITRDTEGWVNLGTYRVMLHDKDTLGFYISPGHHGRIMREKYWSRGESCPVAVSLGQDPLLWTASVTTFRWGVSEYDFAGYLKGEPVEVLKGPITDLPIPAQAEIVIEGEAPPPEVETRIEGPFGEWTGYYGHGARPEPIIKVKAVYHRNDPILQGSPPYKPPLTNSAFPGHLCEAAKLWNEMEDAGVMDIRGVYIPPFAPIKLKIISLKQRFHGHAKQAALVTATHSYTTTFIILVDDDIDPSNIGDVLWAVVSRCDPETSLDIIRKGKASALDPQMSPEKKDRGDLTASTLIIDACRPFHWIEQFPPVNKLSEEMRKKIWEKWGQILT